MGFGGGSPPPPPPLPPPPPPDPNDPATREALERARAAQRQAKGNTKNILTSPTGLPDEPSTSKRVLLGGGSGGSNPES